MDKRGGRGSELESHLKSRDKSPTELDMRSKEEQSLELVGARVPRPLPTGKYLFPSPSFLAHLAQQTSSERPPSPLLCLLCPSPEGE